MEKLSAILPLELVLTQPSLTETKYLPVAVTENLRSQAETSPGKFEIVESVETPRGARTMGIDAANHAIYLPTAEFEDAKPGSATRPVARPNTFMIAVVRR